MSDQKTTLTCGIVMPISAIDDCSEVHWSDVQDILTEAIEAAGFVANLVSNADDVGIIHKRIIQNLYDNPIVIVDVSGKNPNVMFELGMRLAFDKPTIIVKDDKTNYSFDTSPIEHLEYPRDLRFGKIVDFKNKLGEKIRATHERATNDSNYTTFLKHFGEFVVAKIEKKEVSSQEYIIDELRLLRTSVQQLNQPRGSENYNRKTRHDICLLGYADSDIEIAKAKLSIMPGIRSVIVREINQNHKHLMVQTDNDMLRSEIISIMGMPPRKRPARRDTSTDNPEK